MDGKKATGCCDDNGVHNANQNLNLDGDYICCCDKVKKDDIKKAVEEGVSTVKEAITKEDVVKKLLGVFNNLDSRYASAQTSDIPRIADTQIKALDRIIKICGFEAPTKHLRLDGKGGISELSDVISKTNQLSQQKAKESEAVEA